jgi:glycosyltransferase involved in cell wall biosynthesis
MTRIFYEVIDGLYHRAAPLARRWLPASLKRRLFGVVGRIETQLERHRAQQQPPNLSAQAPLLPAETFTGSVVLANNALAWGGAERQLVNTMLGLEARLNEPVILLCQKLGEHTDYDFYKPALATVRGQVRNMSAPTDANALLIHGGQNIRDAIEWLPPDVRERIHCLASDFLALRPRAVHAWQDAMSIEAGYAAALVGVPRIILAARNLAPTNFAYHRPYMRAAYLQLAAHPKVRMLNNSKAGAKSYAAWLGLPQEHIHVLRNGYNFSQPLTEPAFALRAKFNIPATAPLIGSVFRFYDEKRPLLWIEVAARIAAKMPDAHFIVFGTGPLLPDARAAAAFRGFAARLHTPGAAPDAAAMMPAFDVFLLTSKHEGTPNVVLEASACGVPVVATAAGGTAETILDGVTGRVATNDSAENLAAHVLAILSDASFRETCAQKGPAFVKERFGLDRMIDETLAAYR